MKPTEFLQKYQHKQEFQRRLLRWGIEHPFYFPWRKRISRFHALIVEILLQRTRAEQVVPVFNNFKVIFPNANVLAASRITTVRRVIRPLGLIWRANYIKSLGKAIVHNSGVIPNEYHALLSLPGVGPYIAGAYLSLHQGIRHTIIDSNIARLYCRLLNFQYDGETRRKKWIQDFAELITPRKSFQEFNYSLLDFTRVVCKPLPLCNECFLKDLCLNKLHGTKGGYPHI